MVRRALVIEAVMLPDGYERHQVGDAELVAHNRVAAEVTTILAHGVPLYDWAAGLPQPRALRGRAPVYVADLPASGVSMVVRHVWHGGLLAPVTGDRFRAPTRAPVELRNALALRDAGIPTSEILGYVLYPAGAGLRRIDVMSRLIADAFDLGAVVTNLAPDLPVDAVMPAVRTLLHQLAGAHVLHPDLNVKNILLTRTSQRPAATVQAAVIDVDVVRIDAAMPSADIMRANVNRLARSLRKWRTRFGAGLSDRDISAFVESCLSDTDASSAQPRSA